MARIRSIKPEFFTSETIAALPVTARLTFIGLWTYVDDNGVGPDNARLITAAVWPLEDDPTATLQRTREDLARLHEALLVTRYEHSGKRYLFIATWDEHQKVSHPRKPRYPRPDEPGCAPVTSENAPTPERSGNPPESLARTPETFRPEQGAGIREQGTGEENPSSSIASDRDLERVRDDVENVCRHLADRIEANGSKRPQVGKRWRTAARLMLDTDGRTEQQIIAAIDWCQSDEFWRGNILSLPKLREKYDQLRLAARRPGNVVALRGDRGPARSTTDERVGQAMALAARYAAEEGQQ